MGVMGVEGGYLLRDALFTGRVIRLIKYTLATHT